MEWEGFQGEGIEGMCKGLGMRDYQVFILSELLVVGCGLVLESEEGRWLVKEQMVKVLILCFIFVELKGQWGFVR